MKKKCKNNFDKVLIDFLYRFINLSKADQVKTIREFEKKSKLDKEANS